MYQGQTPSLFHLIQGRKRRDARMIIEIRDENGQLQTTTSAANTGGATTSKSTWGMQGGGIFDAVATVRDAIA